MKPPSLLAVLDEADVNLIAVTEVDQFDHDDCRAKGARTWIVSAIDGRNEGATCLGDGASPPVCVMFAGADPAHVSRVMCKQRALARPVEVPAWAQDLFAAMRAVPATDLVWQLSPIQDAVRPSLAITVDEQLFVAIRADAGWLRTAEPVDQMMRLAGRRVLDTTPLTGTQSFGVITSSYSGGSGSGTETTTLTVLQPTEHGLASLATIQIGQFTWILASEDRKRYPKGAESLDARPHVEVQLAPRIEPGALVLAVERETIAKHLQGTCEPSSDDEAELDAPCILRELKAKAGRYKLVEGTFVR
ncbi:MAG: hypothetical protein H0T42_07535 [Deltaproteobacteria bacterium]|nr:hypothetical protein [Deltaproteobacteria bacterium]